MSNNKELVVPILLMDMYANYVKGKAHKIKSKSIILMLMLFSMHMSANHLSIEIQDSAFLFYNTDNLLGLGITLTTEGEIHIDEPKKLDNSFIYATNINDTLYKVGLAGSKAPPKDAPFLKIPYTGEGTVYFDLNINGKKIVTPVFLPLQQPVIQLSSKFPIFQGDSVYLSLSQAFDTSYTIHWYKSSKADSILSSQNSYTLHNINQKDTGIYYCTIQHPVFSSIDYKCSTEYILVQQPKTGDINLDNTVDISDLDLLIDYCTFTDSSVSLSEKQRQLADTDHDSTVAFLDAYVLYQYLKKNIDTLPFAFGNLPAPKIIATVQHDTLFVKSTEAIYALHFNIEGDENFIQHFIGNPTFAYTKQGHLNSTHNFTFIYNDMLNAGEAIMLKIDTLQIPKQLTYLVNNKEAFDAVDIDIIQSIDSISDAIHQVSNNGHIQCKLVQNSNQLNIEVVSAQTGDLKISVYSISGNLLFAENKKLPQAGKYIFRLKQYHSNTIELRILSLQLNSSVAVVKYIGGN